MFKWRRRATSPDPQITSTPAPTPEVLPSPILEKDKPLQYNLISAQLRILDRGSALTIIDAGAHHGHTTEQYLENFPQSRVIGIEPDSENFAKATERVARFGSRVELVRAGLSNTVGSSNLYRNTYDMTHSLLKLGDMRYFDKELAVLSVEKATLAPETIETLTLDSLCAAREIEVVDVLKMDIQGAEVMALQGAKELLTRGAIRLIVLEVNFVRTYQDMPTFWDVAEHLRGYGYELQGIYELRHQPQQPAVLCWADAIFVAPQLQVVSETVEPVSRLDEALEEVGGRPLPAEFFASAYLTEDAAIRDGQSQAVQESTPIAPLDGWQSAANSIANVIIDTTPTSYRYAAVMTADPQLVRNLSTGSLVTVEIAVEVTSGMLGIVWADAEYYPLEVTERFVLEMPGVQRVLISAPAERTVHLVLRNVSARNITGESTRTSFKLVSVRGKVSR